MKSEEEFALKVAYETMPYVDVDCKIVFDDTGSEAIEVTTVMFGKVMYKRLFFRDDILKRMDTIDYHISSING